jgi:serine/threonine protein kinase
LLPNDKYSNKVDIWAVGCICYEVVFLQKAFSSDYEVSKFVMREELSFPFDSGIFRNKRKSCGSEALSFEPLKTIIEGVIQAMLKIDPSARPSARDVNSTFKSAFDERFKLSLTSLPSS